MKKGIFEEFKVFEIPCWGVTVTGVSKISKSDAAPKWNLMAHQMKNLCGFSVFHCIEGAFGVSSGGTPKMKNGAPRDELKNGRGRCWAVPYDSTATCRNYFCMQCTMFYYPSPTTCLLEPLQKFDCHGSFLGKECAKK